MNNAALDILFTRRPVLNYISPAVCEAIFSSTSFPTLILEAIPRRAGITGLRVGSWGTNGVFRLRWDVYPGALCYTVYRLNDANDPLGDYSIVAECISDPEYDPELYEFPFNPEGACYLITAITPEGETPIGEPICPFSCLANGGDLPDAEITVPYSYQLVPAELAPADITSWTVLSGSLPSGLTLSNTGLISGTVPSELGVDGTYDFTVLVTTNLPDPENPPNVITCSADCRIVVPEEVGGGFCIANDSPLPDATLAVPYSVQLLPGSVAPVLQWTVIGTFPPGLVLDFDTGLISGTPTQAGSYTFTVRVQEVPGDFCDKEFQMDVRLTWLVDWNTPTLTFTPGFGLATFTPDNAVSNVFSSTVECLGFPNPSADAFNNQFPNEFSYDGPDVNCNLHLVVTGSGDLDDATSSARYRVLIYIVSPFTILLDADSTVLSAGVVPGTFDHPFIIPDTLGTPVDIAVQVTTRIDGTAGAPGEFTVVGTLT